MLASQVWPVGQSAVVSQPRVQPPSMQMRPGPHSALKWQMSASAWHEPEMQVKPVEQSALVAQSQPAPPQVVSAMHMPSTQITPEAAQSAVTLHAPGVGVGAGSVGFRQAPSRQTVPCGQSASAAHSATQPASVQTLPAVHS